MTVDPASQNSNLRNDDATEGLRDSLSSDLISSETSGSRLD